MLTLGHGLEPGAGPHVYTRTRTRTGRGPACLHLILRTRIFQNPDPLGTVFLTVPADLDPGPDQLNQHFKHTWLFAVSIKRIKIAPELVVFLFLWVLRRRRTELARRVVLRRSKKTKISLSSADITNTRALTCSKDRASYIVLEKTTQAYLEKATLYNLVGKYCS